MYKFLQVIKHSVIPNLIWIKISFLKLLFKTLISLQKVIVFSSFKNFSQAVWFYTASRALKMLIIWLFAQAPNVSYLKRNYINPKQTQRNCADLGPACITFAFNPICCLSSLSLTVHLPKPLVVSHTNPKSLWEVSEGAHIFLLNL